MHYDDPEEMYEYLIHTVHTDEESLNEIVGTICGLVDEYRILKKNG